jgi:hypothetical protein
MNFKVGDIVRAITKSEYGSFEYIKNHRGYDIENEIGIIKSIESTKGRGLLSVKFPNISDNMGWAFNFSDVVKENDLFFTEEDFTI